MSFSFFFPLEVPRPGRGSLHREPRARPVRDLRSQPGRGPRLHGPRDLRYAAGLAAKCTQYYAAAPASQMAGELSPPAPQPILTTTLL